MDLWGKLQTDLFQLPHPDHMLKDPHLLSIYCMPGALASLPHPLIHHTVIPILQLKSWDTLEICVSYGSCIRTVPLSEPWTGTWVQHQAKLSSKDKRRKCLPESHPSYPAPNCPDETVLTEVWPNGLSVI